MELIRSRDWYTTADGADRGYIRPHLLKELWFHTGTACNLSCDFCLEGSSPGDKRLELVKLEDVTPYIDQAVELGVEQFSFTGGEPFLAKDLVKILQQAAEYAPCLVLTNGTDAVQKRLHQLVPLLKSRYPVSFRISIDSHIEAEHDAGRGEGMFDLALQGMKALYDMGFHVSIARHMADGEDTAAVEQQYRAILENYGIPGDTKFVAFPDFLPPGSHGHGPDITTNCMTQFHTEETRNSFMCSFSKMLVKQRGQMRVYACTLVDDDPEYDMGNDLRASLEQQVSMKHHRCFSCFKYGASCSET
ncbi:radical SAM protein [Amphritea sp.]|uniref:radical SAM protein n=1 Tax=Amphritea sp. TaxID=1872502 RepID=UPI003A93191F